MKKQTVLFIIIIATLGFAAFGGQKDTKSATDPAVQPIPAALAPVTIPADQIAFLVQARDNLILARTQLQNVELQLRLRLKVPNEFVLQDDGTFTPPGWVKNEKGQYEAPKPVPPAK